MAKVVHTEKINDLSTPWEGYTGQRVEELIKYYLNDHDQKKVGYMLLPKSIEGDGYYHIKCFASEETYKLWLEDENLHADLLLFNLAIPLIENNGTTYAARLTTSLVTSDAIISTKKDYVVPVMYKGTMSSGGVTENVGIRGNVTIQRSTDGGSTWDTVGSTILNSVDPDATTYTDINIGQYFSDSNPQQIRLRASYTVYDDEGLVVSTAQSAWLTFSNIIYTNLSLKFASNFEVPINGETVGNFPVAYNLSGEIDRKLHIKVYGAKGTLEVTRSISASEYTNALTTYRTEIQDSDAYQILSHGVHTIEAWLTCSDGTNPEGISSEHVLNQILVINKSTLNADLTKSWILVENVVTSATNYVAIDEFCKYSVWVPSEDDPFISSDKTVDVAFVLTDYGTNGIDWSTEYFRYERIVSSGIQYTLPATIEIENSVDDTLYSYLHVLDGNNDDFLYASCGRHNFSVTVDNKEKFSPTAGTVFFLNPKNRNNSEENPKTIINAVDGQEIESTFSDNFEGINDLWVTSADDNQKVLRINAGQKLEINYDWLSPFKSATLANVTLEIDFKVRNVTDEDSPIIQALDELTANFIGLKMAPMTGLIYSRNHITDESQDFRWQEGERTHVTVNIVSSLHPTVDAKTTLPLCRVFINGVINREFIFGTYNKDTGVYEVSSKEWYQNGSKIILGQDAADLDIYSIRCYQTELSSSNVLQDYISTLPTSAEKLKVRQENAILGGSGLVSSDLLKAQGKNVLIWHGTQPYHDMSAVGTGWWEIHIYNSDGSEDLEHSGTICKDTASLKPTRQGSTANTYYYSNIQTKLKDVTALTTISTDKIHSDITWKDVVGDLSSDGNFTENPSGNTHMCYVKGYALKGYYEWADSSRKSVKIVDGWIDGNGMYRGNSYIINSIAPIGQKLVLKINYASCSQSHLMGACKMYNDLHTSIVGKNSLQKDNEKARVAKIQAPFHYFTQGLSDSVAVYQGPGTFGPGKMDDYTWGFDKKKHTNFCMIEGSDNNLPLTDFRIPWQSSRIFCDEEDGEVVGWIYNKAVSLDLDKCVTTSRDVNVQVEREDGTYETVTKTLKAPNETVERKIKEMVNFLYKHNPKISAYIGTFDEFKKKYESGGSEISTDISYWCTSGTEAYCLKRFDNVDQEWVDAGWDEVQEKVVQRNLYTDFPSAVDDHQGQWDDINKAFISNIAADARSNFGNYFKPDSAKFHYALINQFLAGTDNCSKNTYYVLDPETLLWELHQDDVDTILATDNSGFQSKPYYIDRQHPYPENSEKTCYEGTYNVLFNLIEAMYESNGEIRGMMYLILTGMCGLVTNDDTGISHTPWGALQKYFFSTQDYFSAVAYNEAARIRYEYPSTAGFISDRGVDPISQSMGDQVESEKQYMKRRLVLFASYAEWGDFSRQNAGNTGLEDATTNFGIEACKDVDGNNTNIVFQLVPHQYIYPTGAVGETTHYLRQRCKPGESYTFQVNGTTPVAGDTNVVLYGANYYRSFGNLGDLSVLPTRNMTVTGKRLVEFVAEPSNSDKAQFRPSTFTINAPLIEKFSLKGCTGIKGNVNLKNCVRLKTIDTRNTSTEGIVFPETSSLVSAKLPENFTSLEVTNLPGLTTFVLDGAKKLTEVTLKGIPGVNTYSLVSQFNEEGTKLSRLVISDINWSKVTGNSLDYLYDIKNCQITGKIALVDGSKDMTYERKTRYLLKWGNIDDPGNDLYISYTIEKIYSLRISGTKFCDEVGKTYKYKTIPRNISDADTIYGNDFIGIGWSFSGYKSGDKDDSHNWIEEDTGILHVNVIGEEVSADYDGVITCTMIKSDKTKITRDFTVHLYHKIAAPGDYVYADGTYSDELEEDKTVIGICFYVNPDNPEERLAVSRFYTLAGSVGISNSWGAEISSSKYTFKEGGTDLYNIPVMTKYSGDAYNVIKTSDGSKTSSVSDDSMLDSSTKDGFIDFKTLYGTEEYQKGGSNYSLGKLASLIGYQKTTEDILDNQEHPSRWASKNSIGVYVIPKGSRIPIGYINTIYMMNFRNTVLSNIVTEKTEEGEITSYGLPIPVKTEEKSEFKDLLDKMSDVKSVSGFSDKDSNEPPRLYYPALSKCYAFDPTVKDCTTTFIKLKEGEVLNDKFSYHNWFLPAPGDLFRICWYHTKGYDATTENAIFGKVYKALGSSSSNFDKFPSPGLLWSSSMGQSGGFGTTVGFEESSGFVYQYWCYTVVYYVRPCVAF